MRKRIIVCCDGTNNDLRSDGTMWSNVGRIAECISEYSSKDKTTKQVVGYLSGIDSEGGSWLRMKNQATGFGLDEKILAAYGFICNYFEKGDSIVLMASPAGRSLLAVLLRLAQARKRRSGLPATVLINSYTGLLSRNLPNCSKPYHP
ncbi:hypothetical protein NXS19_008052 [Fusarium pseudograminearum]|nr:hypothetical protein NXS19_008052 [Fusarium pseudograminearum]